MTAGVDEPAHAGTTLAAAGLPAPPVPVTPQPRRREDCSSTAPFEVPRNPLEETLVELWSAALQVTPLSIHDDFFEMGGHSLMAAELLTEIQQAVGCQIPARTLYLQPTIAEIAVAICDVLNAGQTGEPADCAVADQARGSSGGEP
jgi:acyl carrier protein